jgi:sulfhydrogenase subunit delta
MKKKIGIYGFTGCAGDQLTIIHSEDKLLPFFNKVEIVSFSMAKSDNEECELDIAFIEGSITTEEQKKRIIEIRERTGILVPIGVCACFGGIQSMKLGDGKYKERYNKVYGSKKITIDTAFESEPINTFVKVDYCIPGCPISSQQFFSVLTKLINDFRPVLYSFPVCTECKWHENLCLLTEKNLPCLGPITRAGCGAVCLDHSIPCVGCWGPVDEANVAYEAKLFLEQGFSPEEIIQKFRMFGGKTSQKLVKNLIGKKDRKGMDDKF